jgi:hypothetical protein
MLSVAVPSKFATWVLRTGTESGWGQQGRSTVGTGRLDVARSPPVDHGSFGDRKLTPRDRAALSTTVQVTVGQKRHKSITDDQTACALSVRQPSRLLDTTLCCAATGLEFACHVLPKRNSGPSGRGSRTYCRSGELRQVRRQHLFDNADSHYFFPASVFPYATRSLT